MNNQTATPEISKAEVLLARKIYLLSFFCWLFLMTFLHPTRGNDAYYKFITVMRMQAYHVYEQNTWQLQDFDIDKCTLEKDGFFVARVIDVTCHETDKNKSIVSLHRRYFESYLWFLDNRISDYLSDDSLIINTKTKPLSTRVPQK